MLWDYWLLWLGVGFSHLAIPFGLVLIREVTQEMDTLILLLAVMTCDRVSFSCLAASVIGKLVPCTFQVISLFCMATFLVTKETKTNIDIIARSPHW